jgi:hypothetical protein
MDPKDTRMRTLPALYCICYKLPGIAIYKGPTYTLVFIKTLIQMSHTKTFKITPTCFDHQIIIIREACRHVDMPLCTIQHAKRMTVCCRITVLEDSHFNQ